VRKVTISERAERNLDGIVLYLETEWSVRVRDTYLELLGKKMGMIARLPYMYEASPKRKTIRRCVINKTTTLYYRVKKEEIEIITIQNTWQNPKKSKLY
jgi:plasmid stabilization system protein ParE